MPLTLPTRVTACVLVFISSRQEAYSIVPACLFSYWTPALFPVWNVPVRGSPYALISLRRILRTEIIGSHGSTGLSLPIFASAYKIY